MSYVQKIIAADEKILSITHLHWIYVVEGIFWLLLFLILGRITDHYLWILTGSNEIGFFKLDFWVFHFDERRMPVTWLFGMAGFVIFLPLFLKYVSVEVGLTDKRVIYKKGLILIQVQQVDLIDMRSENVNHGWLGWLLGYGRLHLDCRFIGDLHLPAVVKPYHLVRAIHVARMRHPGFDYEEEDLERDINALEQKRREAYRINRKRHAKSREDNTKKTSSEYKAAAKKTDIK